MNTKLPIDKLVENEAMFRKRNESVQDDIKLLNEISKTEGEEEVPIPEDTILKFYCECSDEDCVLRIDMSLKEYEQIHTDRKQFVVIPGHEIVAVEEVVDSMANYSIVKKVVEAPENPDTLHQTPVFNV
ncbi:MAG: hypothetical protein ABIQ64_03565 [Candidatus Saccharimonadales bacterium]